MPKGPKKVLIFFVFIVGVLTVILPGISRAGFVYTRTPSGSTVVSPVSIRIQGTFGVDFCTSPQDTVYRIKIEAHGGGSLPYFTEFVNHSQGEIVDDIFQANLQPGRYTPVIIFCGNSGSITIEDDFIVIPATVTIDTYQQLPTGIIAQPYSFQLAASGGTSPYVWSLVSGNLPGGLSLNSDGTISGIPDGTGTFNFMVQVIDINSMTDSKNFTLTVAPQSPMGFVYTRNPTGDTILSPITIRIQGIFGVDFCINPQDTVYRVKVEASGGTGIPYFTEFVNHNQGDLADDTFQANLTPGLYTPIVIYCGESYSITIVDQFTIVPGNTPIGSNVVVGPLSGVTLTFGQVTQEGNTTVASSSFGTTPPSGFKLGAPPIYYDISTTAQFIAPVWLCINYQEGQFNNENNLKLWHFENGQWVNTTTSLDTVNNVICGQVFSLSEFALFENLDINYLISEVEDFNLENDIEQGLLDKLFAAKLAIERDNKKAAINNLKAFTNFIKAQTDKKITNDQAMILLNDAEVITDHLKSSFVVAFIKFLFVDLWTDLLGLISLIF